MTDLSTNPLGIDGFDFVEFAAPDAALLHELFANMGFTAVARHRSRNVTLYRQGDINFLVNEEPDSFAADTMCWGVLSRPWMARIPKTCASASCSHAWKRERSRK